MQLKNFTIKNGKYYLCLLVIALLAYWPLTFHIFSLKNDALSYFLPFRYHVSTSIQNGHFPFWSPYLYTGLPLHADIQSGVWNPVVLIISLFTTYNMNVLQAESLFYLAIGGFSFFKLCRSFGFDKKICLALAVSYMCCGFMIDSTSFIPWITSAAWLPLMLLYFNRTMKEPGIQNSLKLALSTSLVFLSGYPSFFIFSGYLLLFISIFFVVRCYKNYQRHHAVQFLKYISIAAVLAMVICSPALISYIDFFPYYRRGNGISLAASQVNPFSAGNLISYIFPPASYKLQSANDISARNAYVGILPLVLVVYSFRFRFTLTQKLIAVITLICFLFSLGSTTPVRALFYHALPLMDTFRHPGTARLFTSMGLLVLAGFGWNSFVSTPNNVFIKRICIVLLSLLIFVTGYFLFFTDAIKEIAAFTGSLMSRGRIREFMENSSYASWIVLSGIVQVCFVLMLFFVNRKSLLFVLCITNMMVMTFLCMPFTMVSQYHPKQVNAFLQSFPKGFPENLIRQNVADNMNDTSILTVFGYREFYSKNISLQEHLITPTVNSNYGKMLGDTTLRHIISSHPFVYSTSADSVEIKSFTPNSFTIVCENKQPGTLLVTQQYNHNWHASIGDSSITIQPNAIAFMKVGIPRGAVTVKFEYRPRIVIFLMFISLIFLLGCFASLVYFRLIKL